MTEAKYLLLLPCDCNLPNLKRENQRPLPHYQIKEFNTHHTEQRSR